jgi:hypothetical protein
LGSKLYKIFIKDTNKLIEGAKRKILRTKNTQLQK